MAYQKSKEEKQNSYRSWKTQRAGKVATKLLSKAIRRRGFISAEVLTRWSLIVGTDLADVVIPLQLRFPRGERMGATLDVRTEAAFATMLQHHEPRIIESVNRYFGYKAVAKLAIRQGPLPKRRPKKAAVVPPLSISGRKKLDEVLALTKGAGKATDLQKTVAKMMESVLRRSENQDKQ